MENIKLKESLMTWSPPSEIEITLSSYAIINNLSRECLVICSNYDEARSTLSVFSSNDALKSSVFMLFKIEYSIKNSFLYLLNKDKVFEKADEFYTEMYYDLIFKKAFKKRENYAKDIGSFISSCGNYKRNRNE